MRLPISSSTIQRIVDLLVEHFGPDDARGARLDEIRAHAAVCLRIAPHRATDHVVHVEHAAGFFRSDGAVPQREGAGLRDHEHAAQLGEARDHVVGQRVGGATPLVGFADRSTKGITAMDARRDACGRIRGEAGALP